MSQSTTHGPFDEHVLDPVGDDGADVGTGGGTRPADVAVDPAPRRRRRMNGERRMVHVASFRPKPYWWGTVGWIVYFASPIVPGFLIGAIFDEYESNGASQRAVVLIVLLTLAELAIIWGIAVAHRTYIRGVEAAKAVMRANVLDAQLASGGAKAGHRDVPVGDVLVRLRDDPFDMLFLLDNWVDLIGSLIYSSAAAYFLFRIDVWAAIAGIGPLLLLGVGNRLISNRARRYRAVARVAASDVSSFLNATFEASLTVKVTGARRHVLERLARLNAVRGKAAVRDGVWNEIIWTLNGTLADVFIGIALVVAARGPLTSGEITLFFAYLVGMTWLPMRLGGLVTGRRRFEVSAQRMDALVAPPGGVGTASGGAHADTASRGRANAAGGVPADAAEGVHADAGDGSHVGDQLIAYRPMTVLGGPVPPAPVRPPRVPLERLELRGLTLEARGVNDIDLVVDRGELVVVRGPVGSGKSSLLRAVVGLVAIDRGEVLWNGRPVVDCAAFFVPPQCAYVAQVPRLFAESLVDNLRLGHDLDDADVAAGIELAAFDSDVADLPDGLDTLVGARGVRLSGGQVQRAAGARAMAHRPELLVLDDLTSALDVDTELQMWQRLADSGFTVLAASNRPVALARADRVLDLTP
jgi:ATP-binding cassette subfamily B protein